MLGHPYAVGYVGLTCIHGVVSLVPKFYYNVEYSTLPLAAELHIIEISYDMLYGINLLHN